MRLPSLCFAVGLVRQASAIHTSATDEYDPGQAVFLELEAEIDAISQDSADKADDDVLGFSPGFMDMPGTASLYSSTEATASQAEEFDCEDGYLNWKRGWSGSKMRWCCKHKAKGCPESELDIQRRKNAEAQNTEAKSKEAEIHKYEAQITSKIADIGKKERLVHDVEQMVASKNLALKSQEKQLEKFYESTAKKDTDREAALVQANEKAKAVRLREYSLKMMEDDVVNRLRTLDVKLKHIVSTEKTISNKKTEIVTTKHKLSSAVEEVGKEIDTFKADRATQEAKVKRTVSAQAKRKELLDQKKATIKKEMDELKVKERALKVKMVEADEREKEVDQKEATLTGEEKKLQEETEDGEEFKKIQIKFIKQKEEEVKRLAAIISEKEKQKVQKRKAIADMEKVLAKLEDQKAKTKKWVRSKF